MEYAQIEVLRDRHPAWRLLRAQHAPLIMGFLGDHFVDHNQAATPASRLTERLDDYVFALNAGHEDDDLPFPRPAEDYLEGWADPESGWLRRFYPAGSDEVHYDATPAFERAYGWLAGLQPRAFVGTESRLQTAVDLLRQIVHGTDTDPASRLAELQRQRDELDRQIAEVEAGEVPVLGDTAVRERYYQFSALARELLADFRQVEENFRALDRSARERIASWEGSKGELLQELVASRADISGSDQGSSFQAFYDFLLSESRQDELAGLLRQAHRVSADADERLGTVHHDWADAADRTQQTVRLLSEQLRRFLDDQVWLENRRVLDLVRRIEGSALAHREQPPAEGLTIDLPGAPIVLPLERPLHDARPAAEVDSMLAPAEEGEIDASALFSQTFVDQARLAANIRAVLPPDRTTTLAEIIELYPVEQGIAEIVGYLSLTDEDLAIDWDEADRIMIDYRDLDDLGRRVRLSKVTVTRQGGPGQ